MSEQAITTIEPHGIATIQAHDSGASAIMRMIETAVMNPDFSVEKLDHLLAVKERWEASEAKKSYVAAMAAFKNEPLEILKNRKAGFESKRTADKVDYSYATLDAVVGVIAPALAKHGLSHAWRTEQLEGGVVQVTCVLTHELGHAESVTLKAGLDSTGAKNNIQSLGSTVSYLSRYTLLAATGMATADQDDDARRSVDMPITPEQKAELIDLIKRSESDVQKFLAYLKVAQEDGVDGIMQSQFATAKAALSAALAAKQKKGAI